MLNPADAETFDTITVFPESVRALIPVELQTEVMTGAHRDAAPADGQFPTVIYGHGFGGYRQVATGHTGHLASWGYVVASADHLERGMAELALDIVGQGLFDESNQRPDAAVADIRNMIAKLEELTAGNGPLAGRINIDQLAITGHSAGAWAAVNAAVAEPDRIKTWISIAGGAGESAPPQPGLVLIGELDDVVLPDQSYELFNAVTERTLLVNIAGAGHNSFTDTCPGIREMGGLQNLVPILGEGQVARAEDGCIDEYEDPVVVMNLVNHVTVAHLRSEFGQELTPRSLDQLVIGTIAPVADYQVGPTR